MEDWVLRVLVEYRALEFGFCSEATALKRSHREEVERVQEATESKARKRVAREMVDLCQRLEESDHR